MFPYQGFLIWKKKKSLFNFSWRVKENLSQIHNFPKFCIIAMPTRLTLPLGRMPGTPPFRDLGPAPSSAPYSYVTSDRHPCFSQPSFIGNRGQWHLIESVASLIWNNTAFFLWNTFNFLMCSHVLLSCQFWRKTNSFNSNIFYEAKTGKNL